jgi:hypothetical protein
MIVEPQAYDNIANILLSCGFMHNIPQRQDSGPHLMFNSGGNWSQRLYSCANTVKATIKTVSLSYNGTDGSLQNLVVSDMRDKAYQDNNDMPLWGVENTGDSYELGGINLIWGIISPTYADHENVSSIARALSISPASPLVLVVI